MCCGERPGPRPRALLHALCALRALRGCGAVCVACASSPLPQISHIISLGQYSTTLTNVGIARGQFQNWKESQGNYVRHCWGTMKVSDTSGQDYSEQPSQNKRSKNPDPSKRPGTTGVEGTGGTRGPGCGARGRWRRLAGLQANAPSHTSATKRHCVEAAGGTRGPGCGARGRWRRLAGLRDDAPSEARGADGERAGRRPRAHRAARPSRAHQAARPSRQPGMPKGRVPKYPPLVGSLSHCLGEA